MSTISPSEHTMPRLGRAGSSVLQSVRAEGSVNGLLFELSVEQCYANASDTAIEAVYTFPVPWNAVLLGVEFVIAGKVLTGSVAARADGERRYEDAFEDGNSAVLVERAEDGMYTVNVGNLLPGENATVRFRYAQLLSFAQGSIRLVVPTTIAPRYGDARMAGLQPHQIPETDLLADYPLTLSIKVSGEMAGAVLSSPSHRLLTRSVAGSVIVATSDDARMDRDFVLVAEGLAGKSLSILGGDGDGYVALASFCPDDDARTQALPVNLKILVDCSGSMNGERIGAARQALHEVLSLLEPADSFIFSCFGSSVRHFGASFTGATPHAIRKASGWVASTLADMGGTEINSALLSTFALAQPCQADILLITDGDVWEADELVASAERAGQRVFAVGIGSAPASSLLHLLASRTGGACELVAGNTEVPGAIVRMFRRLRQAPVHDVTVRWQGDPNWISRPGRAVLGGETVHYLAGFTKQSPATATLEWCEHGGTTKHVVVPIDSTVIAGDTLARMGAAARMADAGPSVQHELALAYGLVSTTTSLVLVHERDEREKPSGLPSLHAVAHSLPAGWGGIGGMSVGEPFRGPAVWRRESTSNAVAAMTNLGAERYDIPEFLRKQVADPQPYIFRDALKAFIGTFAPDDSDDAFGAVAPVSLDELSDRLPDPVAMELRQLVAIGFPESEVLRAFIVALARQCRADGMASRVLDAMRRLVTIADKENTTLARRMEALVLKTFNAKDRSETPNDIPE
jgi:Ca-activated chloride channel family protein